jgi:hypothetical protein
MALSPVGGNFAAGLQPATMADQALGIWGTGQLQDILLGNYPGLFDTTNMFRAMMTAPFTKQFGGGVENVGYRNQLLAQQQAASRGPIASQGLDFAGAFANMLGENALSLLDIQSLIEQGRAQTSGGLLGALGLS